MLHVRFGAGRIHCPPLLPSALADIWNAYADASAKEARAEAACAAAAAVGGGKRRAAVERLAHLAGDWFGLGWKSHVGSSRSDRPGTPVFDTPARSASGRTTPLPRRRGTSSETAALYKSGLTGTTHSGSPSGRPAISAGRLLPARPVAGCQRPQASRQSRMQTARNGAGSRPQVARQVAQSRDAAATWPRQGAVDSLRCTGPARGGKRSVTAGSTLAAAALRPPAVARGLPSVLRLAFMVTPSAPSCAPSQWSLARRR